MQFLEKLLASGPGRPPRALMVTTAVDPIAHFDELFQEERRETYDDAIPEVELSRTALLFTRIRRCYTDVRARASDGTLLPAHDRDPWKDWLNYRSEGWRTTLKKEVGGYPPIAFIQTELELAWAHEHAVSLESLARAIRNKAEAAYALLWSSCTRSEKLVLIQLAQEGFVNPKSREVVAQLVAKGLVIQRPALAIFNYTFRAFLRSIERDHIIQEWERMEGVGLWQVSGRLIASLLVASGVFFLVTQDFPVQSLLPIISGSGLFGLPLVRSILARVSTKASGSPVAG